MNKLKAKQLEHFIPIVAGYLSHKDREKNYAKEEFHYYDKDLTSEEAVTVRYIKDQGKFVLVFFFWRPDKSGQDIPYMKELGGRWYWFLPTDSHVLGMKRFAEIKNETEAHNYRVSNRED